jgi:hypothetical protein
MRQQIKRADASVADKYRTDQTAPVRSDVEKNFKCYLFIYLFYFAGAGGGPH